MRALHLMVWIACSSAGSSGPPQLIEITPGLRSLSCTAALIASKNPFPLLGAKYTAMLAFGATAPATSTSSITSPSAEPLRVGLLPA